ncbi:MAG: hypothetical protein EBR82_32870 [Caulobacteraceae bacterium]|nr:hypothetical protein [Caulobacteraceae bacterium]
MIRAILDDRKTMTRRIFKFQETNQPPSCSEKFNPKHVTQPCPYGQVGDCMWVKETHLRKASGTIYRADMESVEAAGMGALYGGWTPSIYMPRWASRITLEITAVRVERLQDITEEDAKKEGIEPVKDPFGDGIEYWKPYTVVASHTKAGGVVRGFKSPVRSFQTLWSSINGPDSWASNPWVWVIEFRRAT